MLFGNCVVCLFFFFNDTATTEIYTLSLHDALPIYRGVLPGQFAHPAGWGDFAVDRKSTRLNSSPVSISYAVFCLKKKIKYLSSCCREIIDTYVTLSVVLDLRK